MNNEKLQKLQANVRIGGKGTPRRKKKAVHKVNATDDKRLQQTLKKLALNTIPGIEEVNLFKDDGSVIQFANNPKVQASINANTYVVSGQAETKKLQDLLPSLLGQLGGGAEGGLDLKKIAATLGQNAGAATPEGGAAEATPAASTASKDDDVPELVENFETS
eukprot:TRINITY_DN8753_c0_g1_i1.p1 TRINITY_DN8753_c0_g1~~TRINITY_DN8753_c0_g1_i1.p1  ORF type:complete len:185 (-),score=60.61 TRINITY_DN8753_c0_g1_i1:194-682(-)